MIPSISPTSSRAAMKLSFASPLAARVIDWHSVCILLVQGGLTGPDFSK
jgi:hypothetical protein